MTSEKETIKYKKALQLITDLERGERDYFETLEPKELYDELQDEWWRAWSHSREEWVFQDDN